MELERWCDFLTKWLNGKERKGLYGEGKDRGMRGKKRNEKKRYGMTKKELRKETKTGEIK